MTMAENPDYNHKTPEGKLQVINEKLVAALVHQQELAEIAGGISTETARLAHERGAAAMAALSWMSEMRQELLRQLVTAQEAERARIARDLHDDTGQQVTALLLGLNNLKRVPGVAGETEALETIAQLQALANQIAEKSHRLAFKLRPTALDDIGLLGALQNYAEEWSRWSGLPVELESFDLDRKGLESQHRLPPEIETTIYRVVQEALTNVLRHAVAPPPPPLPLPPINGNANNGDEAVGGKRSARRVSITLQQRSDGEILTVIEDDGPGFDVDAALNVAPSARRLGIFGMQERARLAGGTLSVESTLNVGTTVYLRLPTR